MTSVVRSWVSKLTFKQQSVLLCSLRGCDGLPREDVSKHLTRALRRMVLLNADMYNTAFMSAAMSFSLNISQFVKDIDRYPAHWLMHFTHSCEIIGYKYPEATIRHEWATAYHSIVHALHLKPESEEEMDTRLADNCREVE